VQPHVPVGYMSRLSSDHLSDVKLESKKLSSRPNSNSSAHIEINSMGRGTEAEKASVLSPVPIFVTGAFDVEVLPFSTT